MSAVRFRAAELPMSVMSLDALTRQTDPPDFAALARAAGRAGQDWGDWTLGDEVQAAADADLLPDTGALLAAWQEGQRERRVADEGWRSLWTTAPEDYDCFGTETAESCGEFRGRSLRRVIAHPHHVGYQAGRYGSGLHGAWEEDPRVEEEAARRRQEEWRAEEAAQRERRAGALAWLAAAPEEELADAHREGRLGGLVHANALTHTEASAELRRRQEARDAAERAERWAKCRAAFEDGATLVDGGSDGDYFGGRFYRGRDPHAWYAVRVEPHWQSKDDAEEARVVGEGRDEAGSLAQVADWLASGRLRVAAEGEVPPRPVVERVGQARLREIRRVEVAGAVVWVGRPVFGDQLVLDARGHLVRSRRLREAALRDRHGPFRAVRPRAAEYANDPHVLCVRCGACRHPEAVARDGGAFVAGECSAYGLEANVRPRPEGYPDGAAIEVLSAVGDLAAALVACEAEKKNLHDVKDMLE